MKFKSLIITLLASLSMSAIADQWDDMFNAIVADKASSLPYSLDDGYQVFDISYDTKQRTFNNYIQVTDQHTTTKAIKQGHQQDMVIFCNDPATKASLDNNITYAFIFYKKQTDKPFLTIKSDKNTCSALSKDKTTK